MALVKSIEYVEVSVTASTEPVTTNLAQGQDETQCTPFFSIRTTGALGDQHQQRMIEVNFTDNGGTPAVVCSASARTSEATTVVQIFVVEWNSSISVQQVTVTGFNDGTASVTPAIADVSDQTTAFLQYSYQFTSPPGLGDDDHNDACVQVDFNGASTTAALLQRRATGGDVNGTLYAVSTSGGEFTVAHHEFSSSSAATSATDTITSTVEADTFLMHSYESGETGDDPLDGLWVADLQNSTTVRVRRGVSGTPQANDSTHVISVVECQNSEWDVQRNDALTMSSTSVTDSITAIDQDRSFISFLDHSGHTFSSGRDDSTTGTTIDSLQSAADFSNNSTVRFRKLNTESVDDIVSYEVIQFAALGEGVTRNRILVID